MAHFLCHLGCSHFGALLLDFYFTENSPYWGCVANLGLTNEKKYVVDEMPTTLHWLNFFSESALKKIGPKKLQAIHSIPNCRIIDSNIIKTSSYPTTTVEENASHNLARLNSILLR